MLTTVHLPPQHNHLERYRESVREGVIEQLREEARDLVGASVLHVNATAYGGGVAEILNSMVPLMRDLGILADWKVISGTDEFFGVTKAMHNALQGKPHDWTAHERDLWVETNRQNAAEWDDYDYIFIHDPQPAPLLAILKSDGAKPQGRWIWRCHIDLTNAQPEAWDLLRPFVSEYAGSIWTMQQYVREGMPTSNLMIAPPAIDPLAIKNADMSPEEVSAVLRRYGVDENRPIITQVSRFDPWKDPLGVIDAYRIVKREVPGVQLVLVGSMANDDPEGWEWWEKVARQGRMRWRFSRRKPQRSRPHPAAPSSVRLRLPPSPTRGEGKPHFRNSSTSPANVSGWSAMMKWRLPSTRISFTPGRAAYSRVQTASAMAAGAPPSASAA